LPGPGATVTCVARIWCASVTGHVDDPKGGLEYSSVGGPSSLSLLDDVAAVEAIRETTVNKYMAGT